MDSLNKGSTGHLIRKKSQPSVGMLGFEDHYSWVVACDCGQAMKLLKQAAVSIGLTCLYLIFTKVTLLH